MNRSRGGVDKSAWKTEKVRWCPKGRCDVEICYQTFGDKRHPPVLLLMGMNCQAIMWDEEFCREIASHHLFVIRFDHRDIGLSTKFDHMYSPPPWRMLLPKATWPEPPYQMMDMVDDTVALLDLLEISAAHWVGCSMGGMMAQMACLHRSQYVLSLTSIMSSSQNENLPHPPWWVKKWFLNDPKSSSKEHFIEYKVNLFKDVLFHEVEYDVEGWLIPGVEAGADRSTHKSHRHFLASYGAPNRDQDLHDLAESLIHQKTKNTSQPEEEGAATTPTKEHHKKNGGEKKKVMPFTIIHGAKDLILPPAHGIHTAAVLPGSKFVLLEAMGHGFVPSVYSPIAKEIKETVHRYTMESL